MGSRDSWRGPAEGGWGEKREQGVKPEKFKGERPRTTHFLVEFGRYLQLNKEIYWTESDMMDLFLSCINHIWANQWSLEIEDDYFEKKEGERRWESLKTPRHTSKKHFTVLNEKEEAKAAIYELTQVYGKMDNYIKKFEEITPKTEIKDKGLLVYFQKGLILSIRKKLWDAQPGLDTLEEWKEAAMKAKGQHKMSKAMEGNLHGGGGQQPQQR
jgi:hypothetical protein